MNTFWAALSRELQQEVPNADEVAGAIVRLTAALLLSAIIGWNREEVKQSAGLRTHMLVGLGSALFTLVAMETSGADGTTRVVQGIAAGIGFIGGGAILKNHDDGEVHGLTTAASVWMTAAIGVAAGMGKVGAAAMGVLFGWIVLSLLQRIKKAAYSDSSSSEPNKS